MFTTRDGTPWEPSYLTEIKGEKCIGCGRCYKVCARDVMILMAVNEDDELVACGEDDEFDVMILMAVNEDDELVACGEDDDEEFERKLMVMTNPGNCIGCGACARVCPKDCQVFTDASAIAA